MPHDQSPTEEFVRLLGEYEHSVTAYILSLVPNWHDARDIAQETRLKLWHQFDEFDRSKDFGAWSLTIAYWEVKRFRKHRSREKVQFSDGAVELFAEMAKNSSPKTEDRHSALATCVEKLDAVRRRILGLYYSTKMTMHEIAQQEGQTYEAVRKSLFRTRLSLRECIERVLRQEDGS